MSLNEGIYIHGGSAFSLADTLTAISLPSPDWGTLWLDAMWLKLFGNSMGAIHTLRTVKAIA
jgi:hypothetical protein